MIIYYCAGLRKPPYFRIRIAPTHPWQLFNLKRSRKNNLQSKSPFLPIFQVTIGPNSEILYIFKLPKGWGKQYCIFFRPFRSSKSLSWFFPHYIYFGFFPYCRSKSSVVVFKWKGKHLKIIEKWLEKRIYLESASYFDLDYNLHYSRGSFYFNNQNRVSIRHYCWRFYGLDSKEQKFIDTEFINTFKNQQEKVKMMNRLPWTWFYWWGYASVGSETSCTTLKKRNPVAPTKYTRSCYSN